MYRGWKLEYQSKSEKKNWKGSKNYEISDVKKTSKSVPNPKYDSNRLFNSSKNHNYYFEVVSNWS